MAVARDRRKLTKRVIDAAKWHGDTYVGDDGKVRHSQCIIWDSELPGLGLRITPTGTKTFVVFYRTQAGRKRLSKIDRYPRITLKRARDLAREQLGKVASGGDPLKERKAKRAEQEAAITFAELCDIYMRQRGSKKKSAYDEKRRIEKVLKPALGHLAPSEIDRQDVARIFTTITENAPTQANRVLSLVSSIFNWADERNLVPAGKPNPAAAIRKNKEKARTRVVTVDEEGRLLSAIEACDDRQARAMILLQWYTGSRPGEIRTMRWGGYDHKGGTFRFDDTKAGEDQRVPLSAGAIKILEDLHRERTDGTVAALQSPKDAPIFPQKKNPTKPRADIKRAWNAIRDEADCSDLRLQDFRRTFATKLLAKGASVKTLQKLGRWKTPHVPLTHYAQATDPEMREALGIIDSDVSAARERALLESGD
ncbi:MAG: site-specific integrase [Acidobacteriota bacterium]